VKRAIWVAVFVVIAALGWSSSLQLKAMIAKGELSKLEAQMQAQTNEYQAVLEHRRKLEDTRHKLASLRALATNRFLNGTMLNELQVTTADDVQLLRCKVEQQYVLNEEEKAKTNANNRVVPGRPASVTERILLTLDARDSAPTPGDQVNKFKQVLSDSHYFRSTLGGSNEVRLAKLSTPQTAGSSRPFVLFSVECKYPEKTR
jgi:hypothetical protein